MGGSAAWKLRRGAVLAAVATLHVALLLVLLAAMRTEHPEADGDFASVLLPLAQTPLPAAPTPSRRRLQSGPPRMASPAAAEATSASAVAPATTPEAVDWSEQARRAAAAVTAGPKFRSLGHPAGIAPDAPRQRPAHQAGDQYRLETGEWIVWVSPRCYIVSAPKPLGLPGAVMRGTPSSTVCQDDSKPQRDLFKQLPAYQRDHPR
jgi:hypothetical protein